MQFLLKKTFLLLCVLAWGNAASLHAQCTVNPPTNTPGIYPNPLPSGCVGAPYTAEIQFVFPLDTTVSAPPFGTFIIPFDSFRIDAINQVPAGITVTPNSPNNMYYPISSTVSARGCGDVIGIPTTATLPNDSVVIIITAWATAPFVGVQAGQETLKVAVNIYNTPPATFTVSGTGFSRAFSSTGLGATSWQWDFGDGGTSTLQNPTHTFTSPGVYNTCLITSNGNCSDTLCQSVTIGCPPPPVAFSQSTSGLVASFTDNTPGSPVSWLWDFGDGNLATVQNATHTYSAAGTYTVCLTVTDTCGTDSSCASVTVCPNPVALFTPTANFLTVNFTDNTSGTPTSWNWDFGDGNTSTSQNPSHTYATDGAYTVCLDVTDNCGTSSYCDTILICAELVPAFNFTTNGNGLTYTFTDLTLGNPLSWQWDFGDGNFATVQNPTHTFAASSLANVCLSVTNMCGESDTICQNLNILVVEDDFAALHFTLSPNPAQDGLNIQAGTQTGETQIWISDLAGKKILQVPAMATNGELNLTLGIGHMPAGLYFLTLENNGHTKTMRFIKD